MLEVAGGQRSEVRGQGEHLLGLSVPCPLSPVPCQVRDLGHMRYAEAFALQQDLVARRKVR